MIDDEKLKKIQEYAKQAVDDGRKGLAITLAMDPVVMFAMTSELLRLRKEKLTLEDYIEIASGIERFAESGDER